MRELTVYVMMIGIAVGFTFYGYFAWKTFSRDEEQDFSSTRSRRNGGGATKRSSNNQWGLGLPSILSWEKTPYFFEYDTELLAR